MKNGIWTKQSTINSFFSHYPQFKSYPIPEGDFNWLWYYAMQQMGDDESVKDAKELHEKLVKRNEVSANIAQFIPTLHLQIQLNEIAKSGLSNQLLFWDEMGKFHEGLRLYFYPKIFREMPANAESWAKFKVQTFTDYSQVNYPKLFLPLFISILFFGGMGWINFRKVM